MRTSSRSAGSALLLLTFSLLLLASALPDATRGSVSSATITRLSGPDRYATAAAVSRHRFAPGVPEAFVATGLDFPDALAGGAAAARRGAPLLLVTANAIPAATADELRRLRPGRIVALGGPAVVSEGVKAGLAGLTHGSVSRIAGSDRYETAAAISASTFESSSVVFIATGRNFPDGVSASMAAASRRAPVLMVGTSLPAATARELERLKPASIVVAGGPSAVSESVMAELSRHSATVRRHAGSDRYATAAALSAGTNAAPVDTLVLATGTAFPDALVAATLGNSTSTALLLVRPTHATAEILTEAARLNPKNVVVVGGTAAVSDSVVAQVHAALADVGGSTPAPTPTPLPTPLPSSPGKVFGVAVAGGSFGDYDRSKIPGIENRDYIYPADAWRMAYLNERGLTLVRIDFLWERVQRAPFASLHASDVAGLRRILDAAHSAGQLVILDMHNYGRYDGRPLGRADAPMLADAWARIATEFRDHPALWGYELMNEPHDLPGGSDTWAFLAQTATDAIRRVDRDTWVLVPGYTWQTAAGWPGANPTLNVVDPTGRLLYAAHQYFDAGTDSVYGGYDAEGMYPDRGVDLIKPFQTWLDQRNARGIITEYGVPADGDGRWLVMLDRFLTALDADPQIIGGTYWATGPWWGQYAGADGHLIMEPYPLSAEPVNGIDRPQMEILARHPSR